MRSVGWGLFVVADAKGFAVEGELQFARYIFRYGDFVSRRRKELSRSSRAQAMQMVNHQRHGLALFLNTVPSHQVGQGLAGAGQRVKPQLLFAAALSLRRGSFASPRSLLTGLSELQPWQVSVIPLAGSASQVCRLRCWGRAMRRMKCIRAALSGNRCRACREFARKSCWRSRVGRRPAAG